MMGHPLAVWTFPHVERRRRAVAFAVGVVVGMAGMAAVFLLGVCA